jgi:hypothetical protein
MNAVNLHQRGIRGMRAEDKEPNEITETIELETTEGDKLTVETREPEVKDQLAGRQRRYNDVPQLLTYTRLGIQFTLSMTVVVLCCYKIVTADDTSQQQLPVYWATLTGTVSSWLPSPTKHES